VKYSALEIASSQAATAEEKRAAAVPPGEKEQFLALLARAEVKMARVGSSALEEAMRDSLSGNDRPRGGRVGFGT
jgi:hypothetical protein